MTRADGRNVKPMSNEPEQGNPSSRRGLWAIGGVVGVAVIALVIWLVVRDDGSSSTDTDPMDDSSEMTDEPSDEMTDDMDDDMSDEPTDEPSDDMTEDMSDDDMEDNTSAGVYRDYEADLVAADGFDRTILFFHAEWCPECRAFEKELTSTEIPDSVQFLKVDYDNEQDLKDKYGVQLQTTFVEVDDDGEEMSKWVGYEEDRSVETIFAGLEG